MTTVKSHPIFGSSLYATKDYAVGEIVLRESPDIYLGPNQSSFDLASFIDRLKERKGTILQDYIKDRPETTAQLLQQEGYLQYQCTSTCKIVLPTVYCSVGKVVVNIQ
eukprot:Awhi_evm2s339